PRLRRRIDALQAVTSPGVFGGGPTLDATVLTTIAMACRGEGGLGLEYQPGGGDGSSRHVEPHRLVSLGRRWYLIAWDLDRGDWRSFRVDRLSGPALTGGRFRARGTPGVCAVAGGGDSDPVRGVGGVRGAGRDGGGVRRPVGHGGTARFRTLPDAHEHRRPELAAVGAGQPGRRLHGGVAGRADRPRPYRRRDPAPQR